jgi:hypothetical protein
MRVLVPWLVAIAACAYGADRGADDVDDPDATGARRDAAPTDARPDAAPAADARSDAPSPADARPPDASGAIDGGTIGGVECPANPLYYNRAIIELSGVNPRFCASGAECTTSQCCYSAIVCVPYP